MSTSGGCARGSCRRFRSNDASAAVPAARNARRVLETDRECPIAHRSSDGDRPARYEKRGAAKLDRRVREVRCRVLKSDCPSVGSSSSITNQESDPLGGACWGIRNQPDPNEVTPWIADASPATDEERCAVEVNAGFCRPAPPGVQRSSRGARCGNGEKKPTRHLAAAPHGVHLGRARRRGLGGSARPTADEDDESARANAMRTRMHCECVSHGTNLQARAGEAPVT